MKARQKSNRYILKFKTRSGCIRVEGRTPRTKRERDLLFRTVESMPIWQEFRARRGTGEVQSDDGVKIPTPTIKELEALFNLPSDPHPPSPETPR
jgi:hypothetical protein